MSVREEEEDREKSCPSRSIVGFGVAAAAIGVGIGAALYYFRNTRQANPNTAGSTSRDWNYESDHALVEEEIERSPDNSFTTISEHTTTDTSMNDSTISRCVCSVYNSSDDYTTVSESDSNSTQTDSCSDDSDNESELYSDTSSSESELDMWDRVDALERTTRSLLKGYYTSNLGSVRSNRSDTQLRRDEEFRKRSWTLEECSICFDVILRDQEVMSLPCTHHFHSKCILPWIQQQQTCPNCRKPL